MPHNKDLKTLSRREFLSRTALGAGGTLLFLNGCGAWMPIKTIQKKEEGYSLIAVDFNKCTGCRTCEAVCSAYNNPVDAGGVKQNGLGNPAMANIRVDEFNPDVSVPNVCAMCSDAPCIQACPVSADPATGRRALYRDGNPATIQNDPDRCIRCGSCAEACKEKSVGIIAQNPETELPEHMCTLCDGDPQCVAHCPYEALSVVTVISDREFYRTSPEKIADQLNRRWYTLSGKEA